MRISPNLGTLFLADSFQIFSRFFCFPLSLPFLFSLSSTLYPLSIHWKSFGLSLQKTWKWTIDQLGDLTYFTTNFAPQIGDSVRKWSIFKTDTRMDGSVLAVLAAYQKAIWCRQKMMTSQVNQCVRLQCRKNTTLAAKELIDFSLRYVVK